MNPMQKLAASIVLDQFKCGRCRHWRDKAWTEKGWGVCDNPKNETKVSGLSMIRAYVPDEAGQKELRNELEQGIRYPEDFGCIFFEPIKDAL